MKTKDLVGFDFACLIKENYNDLHVLEFSSKQNQFHVQPLLEALATNQRHLRDNPGSIPDYVPVFVGTFEQCNKSADDLESLKQSHDDLKDTLQKRILTILPISSKIQ